MTLWFTHIIILHITVFETHVTCIFTQQAHDVLIMLMQRCINVSLTLSWSHVPAGYLHVFIFTRHRRKGTIEMTLICLCVHPSILHSICLSVRPIFFHNYNSSYTFRRTDLKFHRLPSYMYHMKMCTWFLIFVSAMFYQVMALTDSYLDPATPATSFVELA